MKRKGYERTQRIADLLQKTIARMLLQDMTGDKFQFVTVTSVTVTRDLSYAKIYVTLLVDEPDKIKATVQALNLEEKMLRYNMAKEVKLRVVPELKFVYDESTAHGFSISTLIDSAVKKSEKN